MIAAALAGLGAGLLLAWASARLERWWDPRHRWTHRLFEGAGTPEATGPLAAAAASWATTHSAVAAAAAATLCWVLVRAVRLAARLEP